MNFFFRKTPGLIRVSGGRIILPPTRFYVVWKLRSPAAIYSASARSLSLAASFLILVPRFLIFAAHDAYPDDDHAPKRHPGFLLGHSEEAVFPHPCQVTSTPHPRRIPVATHPPDSAASTPATDQLAKSTRDSICLSRDQRCPTNSPDPLTSLADPPVSALRCNLGFIEGR